MVLTLWAETFLTFGRKFWQGSQNCNLRLMSNVLWSKFSARLNFFCHFWSLYKNKSGFWQKEFWRVVIIAFYVSKWTFWGTFFLEKNINFYGFQTLSKKLKKLLDIWQKIFCGVVKIAFYVSILTAERTFFLEKMYKIFMVFRLWAKNFLTSGKNYRQVSQNFNIRLMGMFCGVYYLHRLKFFLVIFGVCSKTCLFFGKNDSGELSKLHSTCPNERFEELFFWKKI